MSLAEFVARDGDPAQGMAILEDIVKTWPAYPWGYVALSDAHAHLFGDLFKLPRDPQRAQSYLEQALPRCTRRYDRDAILERLADLTPKEG